MQAATKLRYDNFVNCFAMLKWQNATKAAIEAGYKPKYARQQASDLCTVPYIKQAIFDKKVAMAEKAGFTIATAQIEYEEAREMAKQTQQPAAMVSATTGKARLYGMDKDAGSGEKTIIVISPRPPKVIDSKEIE